MIDLAQGLNIIKPGLMEVNMYRDDLIRAKLGEKSMTLADLSAKTGITAGTLSFIQRGKVNDIKLSTLKAIANALEIDIRDLLASPEIDEKAA
jgi:DNA-binding Xre family transcriptional regulator